MAAGWSFAQPAGTQLDFAPPDGVWDTTFDGTSWDPPMTEMPPVGTLVDGTGDGNADADLIDRNGNGVSDAVADIDTGAILMEIEEPVIPVGPRPGTTLDFDGDGVPENTYDGESWNPPILQTPPVGTRVDMEGDGIVDANLIDRNNNGIADAVADADTGAILMELEEQGGDGPPDGGIPAGTQLDFAPPDGVWDTTFDGTS
jgi:hypothetical protein